MNKNPSLQRILVVDDDDLNRRLVMLTFTKLGYEVDGAASGDEAIARIARNDIDLVLLDITMPVMDGIEVLKNLRQQYTMLELPVMMFTADDQEERIVEALSLGANDYLLKPLNPSVAAARIKTQLAIASLSNLKDEFLRFASHDLKKPMLVIADVLEAFRASTSFESGSEQDEFLGLISNTNQRMQEVVDGFLNRNQLQLAPQQHNLNLDEIIMEVIQLNKAYAEKKQIEIDTVMLSGLPALKQDAFKIRQVLDNMLGNAIKFCPTGSKVTICTLVENNLVRIEVIDNGPGLTDEDLNKVFKHGAQLSNKPTGGESSTGVGLNLCKKLIESEGGMVGAHANPGQGATFWFSLPIQIEGHPINQNPASEMIPTRGG